MVSIEEVLNRRSDLSTFCVHLTRDPEPLANLAAMLDGKTIEARNPMGWAAAKSKELGAAAEASQKVVCFSETPLEQVYSLIAPIEGRQVPLQGYGLAFTKMVVRRKGGNPVWYVDTTPGRDWVVAKALDALRDEAVGLGAAGFAGHPAAKLFPFCEWMGTWPTTGRHKEFWWEREWRNVGDFHFTLREVALIIAPEATHPQFNPKLRGRCIDATWSLERMIAALVGLPVTDVNPFYV